VTFAPDIQLLHAHQGSATAATLKSSTFSLAQLRVHVFRERVDNDWHTRSEQTRQKSAITLIHKPSTIELP